MVQPAGAFPNWKIAGKTKIVGNELVVFGHRDLSDSNWMSDVISFDLLKQEWNMKSQAKILNVQWGILILLIYIWMG